MKFFSLHIALVVAFLSITSCSTTKVLNENEFLYKEAQINIKTGNGLKSAPSKKLLKEFTSPQPNRKFLNIFPFKLWMYNLVGDSVGKKGFRHWLKHKVGEPPVVFKQYYVETSRNELKNALQNRGFFYHTIETERKEKKQKVTMLYSIKLESPYKINSVNYPKVTDSLTYYTSKYKEGTLIIKEKRYNLGLLKLERQRIDNELKKNGFFYFSPDFLFFELDTVKEERLMDITLSVKREIPKDAKAIYNINDIFIHHNYSLEDNTLQKDTLISEGIHHLSNNELKVKPSVIANAIFLKTGEPYNNENYIATLNKLTNLGVYKFVNIRFKKNTASNKPLLDVHIYLTRSLPKSLRAEFQTVSKSNDFVGPGIRLNYRDRNLNEGAEFFLFNINSGFETQLAQNSEGINSFEIGTQVEVTIPRLILPFYDATRLVSRKFSPETRIKTGYNFFNRTNFFTANTFNLSYGYRWRETQTKTHDLDVLSIDYLAINNIKPSLKDSYITNRNLNEQFIFGLKYSYTINDLLFTNRKINKYFNVSAEFAGHTLSLFSKIFNDNNNRNDLAEILGIAYSQYTRLYADYRLYYNLSSRDKLVGRIFAGIGLPYGNSSFLPYKKQFYTGGTTSIRAFRSRSLGPGSYGSTNGSGAGLSLEQAGDIKLEANLEYRFDITKMVKGAFFADAGNVWLLKEEKEIPGGQFNSSSFLKELALGTGAGIRFDASFFVIRLDVAFPLRKPFLPKNERWVIDSVNLLNSDWRKDNLIYNIAIGYPF